MEQYSQLIFIALIIGAFYFLVIKPQQTRAKKQKEMIAAIKPGDEIVTIGGIFGTVLEVDDRIRVRVASGAELEIAKQAVGQVVPADDPAAGGPGPDAPIGSDGEDE
jgi:preprotein translocase subunit YajC